MLLNKKNLQAEWATFLSHYPWQWFCTLTFAESPHPEAAFKTFRYFVNRLNRNLYGSRAQRNGHSVHWCLALEYHKSGVIHFHALIGDNEDINGRLSRIRASEIWREIAGFPWIVPIDDELLMVTNYVSKYIAKGGEIELSGNLSDFKLQYSGLPIN